MSKVKKILILFGMFLVVLMIFGCNKVKAASSSLTENRTVTQGSSVTITGTVNAFAWNMTLSGVGQSKSLVGNSSVASNQSASTSITFTASNIGTYVFTFSGDITDISANNSTPQSRTCTITVVAANTGNNSGGNTGGTSGGGTTNNTSKTKMTSLGITPYEYDFQNYSIGAPSGSTYYAKVPNEVSSITIYANGATSGTGTKTLKEGTNKFTVSNADFTYYIIVTRATLDGDEPANKSDGEEQENSEENDGIGLESLEIEGYELDKEFETSVYEYVVKVEEDLTLEKLNEIKELVIAVANTEGVTVRVEAEISEEGVATITVFVEDEEKEYAKYVITFEVEDEEKDEVIGVVAKTNNSKGTPITGMFGLTEEQQIFAILAAFGLVTFIAFVYSVVAYVQHRKLLEYEEEYDEEYEDDTEFGKMNRYYNDVETPDSNIDEIDNTQTVSQEEPNVQLASEDDKSTLEKAVDYERKLFKSRGLRSTRKGGKHF
ncbi:MAG: hypothetical protein J6K45_08370 [Clostridia bacterium]|nr:hypothetical protein [Clostridia bacterium]